MVNKLLQSLLGSNAILVVVDYSNWCEAFEEVQRICFSREGDTFLAGVAMHERDLPIALHQSSVVYRLDGRSVPSSPVARYISSLVEELYFQVLLKRCARECELRAYDIAITVCAMIFEQVLRHLATRLSADDKLVITEGIREVVKYIDEETDFDLKMDRHTYKRFLVLRNRTLHRGHKPSRTDAEDMYDFVKAVLRRNLGPGLLDAGVIPLK